MKHFQNLPPPGFRLVYRINWLHSYVLPLCCLGIHIPRPTTCDTYLDPSSVVMQSLAYASRPRQAHWYVFCVCIARWRWPTRRPQHGWHTTSYFHVVHRESAWCLLCQQSACLASNLRPKVWVQAVMDLAMSLSCFNAMDWMELKIRNL